MVKGERDEWGNVMSDEGGEHHKRWVEVEGSITWKVYS